MQIDFSDCSVPGCGDPDAAIGVFDSGVGGLTVLQELRRLLPQENLIYLGDTARVPYGTKSAETVQKYACEAAAFLVGKRVKMVVVACNTASSVALDLLREQLPVPVIGVIEPGASGAIRVSRSGIVGVIGTEGTVASDAYPQALRALNPEVQVYSAPCPLFVPLAEEGWAQHQIAALAAQEYLAPLLAASIDTLVLGCTHYPLLKPTLKQLLPTKVELVDSAWETAQMVWQILQAGGMLNRTSSGEWQFFVTDVPRRFVRVGGAFLGADLAAVERVRLASASV